MKYIYIYIYT